MEVKVDRKEEGFLNGRSPIKTPETGKRVVQRDVKGGSRKPRKNNESDRNRRVDGRKQSCALLVQHYQGSE